MAIALLLFGIVFIVSGVRGTDGKLLALLKNDLTGNPSFIPWITVILIIGALGYIEPVKPFSRAFLFLVIVVLLLRSKGFFENFLTGIGAIPQAQQEGA